VRTEDWLSVKPEAPAKACAIIKADVGWAGVPEDVAETIVHVAWPEAGYATGSGSRSNGGAHLGRG
jgi:NAD(P)-dependent dehydrogenase (short-subunit alcohol dehydrogenase family)